ISRAQQPLQPLMWTRLPFTSGKLVPALGVEARMKHDEGLCRDTLGPLAVPQQRQVRCEQRLVLRDRDAERRGYRWSARAAGDKLGRPAEHLFEERPSIVQFV